MSAIVDIIVYVIGLAPIDTDAIVGRQARDYRLPGRRDVTRFLHNCPLWQGAIASNAKAATESLVLMRSVRVLATF